ncbi:MAG TPA: hypothetical protein VFR37_10100 [Longimicrobium sp.]|nr:hypothetical protein [Longimicrobium sp.]
MTAAPLRRTARWTGVVGAESAALFPPGPMLLTLLAAVVLTAGPFSGGGVGGPFSDVRDFMPLMFFLPLLHWRGRAGRGSLDVAMPVAAPGYDLVRVGCGALAAAVTMALVTGVHAWSVARMFALTDAPDGYPASYPLALTLTGVAYYLFGSAVMLRAPRPGRVLLAVFGVAVAAMFLTGVGLEGHGRTVSYARDGSVTAVTYTTSLTLLKALVWLACGAAAVLAAAWVGRHEEGAGAAAWSSPWPGARRPRAAAPPARLPAVRRIPRPLVPAGALAIRQLELLFSRIAWPMAMAAAAAAWFAIRETRSSFVVDPLPFVGVWFVAFFWPLLVWVDEGSGRDWDEARPVDAFTRHLLLVGAGLAWLQAALHLVLIGCVGGAATVVGVVAALRDVPGWAWPGLPLCATALYCLGSLPALLSRRPVAWSIIGFLLLAQGLIGSVALLGFRTADAPVLAPARVFAPAGFAAGGSWSLAAGLVWIPVFAALVVAAVHRRVQRDRQGGFAGMRRAPAA